MLNEWELYSNMAVYWPYLHASLGVPYDTSIFQCFFERKVTVFQHTRANTALEHPNMIPYGTKRGNRICLYDPKIEHTVPQELTYFLGSCRLGIGKGAGDWSLFSCL